MKRIIISLLSVGLLFSSCEKDFDKINTNPNQPEEYLTAALFGNASFGFLYNLRKNENSASLMRTWMQYISETTYTKESRYQYKEGAGNNLWKQTYKRAEVLNKIIKLNTDPETKGKAAIFGSNLGQISAARTMMAYLFSTLTETFGDVPYYSYGSRGNKKFQALQLEDYITPEYADQKDIYLDLLKELGEVSNDLKTLNENDEIFSQGDFIFGSVGKLKRFTNSLRLRIANHVKNVSDAELKAAALAVVNHYVGGNEAELLKEGENVTLLFEDNYDYCAPIYNDYFIDQRMDYVPSNTFVKFLIGTNKHAQDRGLSFGVDPRVQKYFAPVGTGKQKALKGEYNEPTSIDTTKYKGMPYGMAEGTTESQFGGGTKISIFSSTILKPDYREVLMDYSEVCFILSEIRGWNNNWYKAGVKASMEKWNVNPTKATNFINSLPAATAETVMTQKYVALYMNPNEGWTEYRRTGYPKFLIKVGERVKTNHLLDEDGSATDINNNSYIFESMYEGNTGVPERVNYPLEYKGLNQANYDKARAKTNGDSMMHKLIFAENRP